MRRTCFPLSLAALVALALVAPAPGSASEAQPQADSPQREGDAWLPLAPGHRWTYQFSRERTRNDATGVQVVEQLRGTLVEEVVATAPEVGSAAFEVRSRIQGRSTGAATDTVEQHRLFLELGEVSTRLHAREAADPLSGESELTRFSPPLESLPVHPKKGHRWRVGTERSGGIETQIEGEILGVQDVRTPNGLYPRCLVVRTRGSHQGSLDLYGTRIDLRGGETVSTSWYAPGVGRVLLKEETTQRVALPDGSEVEFEETIEYALSDARFGGETADAGPAEEPDAPLPAAPAEVPAQP